MKVGLVYRDLFRLFLMYLSFLLKICSHPRDSDSCEDLAMCITNIYKATASAVISRLRISTNGELKAI